ncbi:MAG: ACP phosphodiesterase [Bacteroidota bacterium]
MNFLAHLLLSCEQEELLVGNFLGDFIKNREVRQLPVAIQQGVRLHRLIDSFTDAHPVVRQGTARLRPRHGKYAGVVLDILYDYILANNWSSYGPGTLPDFTQQTYRVLAAYTHLMPSFLQQRLPHMIADDWLLRYGTREGVAFTFSRLQLRVSQPQFLENTLLSLTEHETALAEDFSRFFPDLTAEAAQFCTC